MLSVELGPGLLGQVFDGLQNPLHQLAEKAGFFLEPGIYLPALSTERKWSLTPTVEVGATVRAGDTLGTVPEGIFTHCVMVPFGLRGTFTVERIADAGLRTIDEDVAVLVDASDGKHPVTMQQKWPVKLPLNVGRRRLMPSEPLVTRVRIIDSMFPITSPFEDVEQGLSQRAVIRQVLHVLRRGTEAE